MSNKDSLMDYCEDIEDFLDRVTDDIYMYICDYKDDEDQADLINELKEAYYMLVNAYNIAKGKTE